MKIFDLFATCISRLVRGELNRCLSILIFLSATVAAAEKEPLLLPEHCFQYAEFKQEKYLQGLAKPLVTRGKIVLDCNRGTLWQTTMPIQEATVYQFSGKQWVIKANGEVNEVDNATQKRIGGLLARIMRGDQKYLDRYFVRETLDQVTRLIPKRKRLKKFIDYIELQSAKDGMQVVVKRVDGQNMTLQISNVQPFPDFTLLRCQELLKSNVSCQQLFQSP